MEWWSNDVLLGILGDTGDPVFVVTFLFQLVDQAQQTVLDFIMQKVEIVESRFGNLLGLTQTDRARHRFCQVSRARNTETECIR